jgi:hypothetical protein
MRCLEGWEGPVETVQGYRYCRAVGWTNLYIMANGSEFWGGISGPGKSFEICREGEDWVRYETDLAVNARGDIQLVLRGGTTWAVRFKRFSEGEVVATETRIECPEDLAAYLESCASDR